MCPQRGEHDVEIREPEIRRGEGVQGEVDRIARKKKEMVVARHGEPIARVVPVTKGSPDDLLLEIGMVLREAGDSKEEALRALQAARKAQKAIDG